MSFVRPELLPLAGGCNLRDVGGHGTADGRRIARGRLFRSGVLTYMTPEDHARVAELGIATVVDLRRPDEIETEPTRWPAPIRTLSFPEDPVYGPGQKGAPWGEATTPEEARAWLINAYVTMSEWLVPQLRALLKAIAAGETPVLFHCAAGKDRTGFCAGVVLTLAGVDEETVLREFAFTNEAVDLYKFTTRFRAAGMGLTDEDHPMDRMEPELRAALVAADPIYLKAALDHLVERHGSVRAYAESVLGLSADEIDRIRTVLVEDAR